MMSRPLDPETIVLEPPAKSKLRIPVPPAPPTMVGGGTLVNRTGSRVGWTLLVMVLCSAFAATASAETVDVATLSQPKLEARIKESGWTLVSAPIVATEGEYRSWIWAVTRGVVGGAVGLYVYNEEPGAAKLEETMTNKADAAVLRSGKVVVSVIMTGRPEDAKSLLAKLVEVRGKPLNTGIARAALFGARPLPIEGGPKVPPRAVPTKIAEALPEITFRHLSRAELIHGALSGGWALASQPMVTKSDEYTGVTYTLSKGKRVAALSVYACGTETCRTTLGQLSKANRDSAMARDGDTVVIAVVPGARRSARDLIKAATRAAPF